MPSDTGASSGPTGPAGPRARQRPAPTIDLKATEIASDPAREPDAPEQDQAPIGEAPAAASSDTTASTAEASADQGPESDDRNAGAPPDFAPSVTPRSRWRLPIAGAVGALLAVLVLLALDLAGVFSDGRNISAGDAVEKRLAQIERQVHDLAARPSAAPIDPKAIDALTARVAKLEGAAATPRSSAPVDPALDNRIATLEGSLSALSERVGVVERRTDDIGTAANDARAKADAAATTAADVQKAMRAAPPSVAKTDVDALATRIAALEKSTKALEAALAKRPTGLAEDQAVRLGVAAALLKAAVERGDPFAAELDAAKSLAPDPKTLAPLDAFATTGVPSASALARELSALAPALAKAAGPAPREGGLLDRLEANAEKLVRVRPIDDVPGDTPDAIVSRVEARAARGDIDNALTELAKLPAPARAPAQAWIAKAQARAAALEASRRFAAAAVGALGQPSP